MDGKCLQYDDEMGIKNAEFGRIVTLKMAVKTARLLLNHVYILLRFDYEF